MIAACGRVEKNGTFKVFNRVLLLPSVNLDYSPASSSNMRYTTRGRQFILSDS